MTKIKPKLALIVAATVDGEIGYKNTIPWKLKGDLPRFKKLTMGNVVISGRSTHETLPEVMEGRIRIVMSRSPEYVSEVHDPLNHIYCVSSMDEALELARSFQTEMIFFIGGASIYEEALSIVDKAYVTLVYKTAPRYDTKIKNFRFDEKDWISVDCVPVLEHHALFPQIDIPSHSYYTFERIEKN